MESRGKSGVGEQITEVATVATLWVLLYEVNRWLFSAAQVSEFASWIFLPAALRVLAVLILGWKGALGLYIGAMCTYPGLLLTNLPEALLLSSISAVGPWLMVGLTMQLLKVPSELTGLTFKQLVLISVASSVFCAGANSAYHHVYKLPQSSLYDWTVNAITVITGDIVGTLFVLYLVAAALRRVPQR